MEYKNKQQKELGIWLIIQLQGFQKIHDRIIEKQLQISIIKKYLKKMCIFKKKKKKKERKLFIIWY